MYTYNRFGFPSTICARVTDVAVFIVEFSSMNFFVNIYDDFTRWISFEVSPQGFCLWQRRHIRLMCRRGLIHYWLWQHMATNQDMALHLLPGNRSTSCIVIKRFISVNKNTPIALFIEQKLLFHLNLNAVNSAQLKKNGEENEKSVNCM